VRTLCLNATGVVWQQLLEVAVKLPNLRELHFNANGVTSLCAKGDAVLPLQQLQILSLQDNAISEWSDVSPLAGLPLLDSLNLNGNRLKSVPPLVGTFNSLRQILLRSNSIDEWRSLDSLDSLVALREARLSELPVLSGLSAAVARRHIIARIGGLTVLNSSEVRTRERDDAERFYLRHIAENYPTGDDLPRVTEEGVLLPSNDAWAALELSHPRIRTLLCKHGEQRPVTQAGAAGGVLGAELIELTLRSASAAAASVPAVTRRLPGGLPLKNLKLIAHQLFKIEPTKQRLFYYPPGQDKDIPEPLDDDLKRLCDFAVTNGGTIVLDELES